MDIQTIVSLITSVFGTAVILISGGVALWRIFNRLDRIEWDKKALWHEVEYLKKKLRKLEDR